MEWECPACTFFNRGTFRCVMCSKIRGSTSRPAAGTQVSQGTLLQHDHLYTQRTSKPQASLTSRAKSHREDRLEHPQASLSVEELCTTTSAANAETDSHDLHSSFEETEEADVVNRMGTSQESYLEASSRQTVFRQHTRKGIPQRWDTSARREYLLQSATEPSVPHENRRVTRPAYVNIEPATFIRDWPEDEESEEDSDTDEDVEAEGWFSGKTPSHQEAPGAIGKSLKLARSQLHEDDSHEYTISRPQSKATTTEARGTRNSDSKSLQKEQKELRRPANKYRDADVELQMRTCEAIITAASAASRQNPGAGKEARQTPGQQRREDCAAISKSTRSRHAVTSLDEDTEAFSKRERAAITALATMASMPAAATRTSKSRRSTDVREESDDEYPQTKPQAPRLAVKQSSRETLSRSEPASTKSTSTLQSQPDPVSAAKAVPAERPKERADESCRSRNLIKWNIAFK